MNKLLKYSIICLFIFEILAILFSFYKSYKEESVKQKKLSLILRGGEKEPVLGIATKSSDCQIKGALPDPECTPGKVFENATKETICIPGYTKKVRNVSSDLKKRVYEKYNLEYPKERGSYEADHLIPLELGGSNDIENLWPEAADPPPGFKEKDVVENFLHGEVCAGRVALSVAQEKIAADWISVYNNLNSDQIRNVKNNYKNWSE